MALDIDTGRILENFTGTLLRFKGRHLFRNISLWGHHFNFMGKYFVVLEAPALI